MITSLLLLTIYYNEEKNKISDVEYQNVKIVDLEIREFTTGTCWWNETDKSKATRTYLY